jgi:tetratricopeptide (TPR) repeat protein
MSRPVKSTPKLLQFFFLVSGIVLLGAGSARGMTAQEIQQAYSRSYGYEKVQDYGNAINALAQVIEQYPAGYTVNLRLGWLYYLKQNYADSLKNYAASAKSAPLSIEARLGSLLPLLAQGRYDQVEAAAYQILQTDRYNFTANLRLAVALRLEKKYELAGRITQQMLTLYPTDVTLLTEMGLLRQAEGQVDAATAIFGDILVLDPENIAANSWFTAARQAQKTD